MPKLVLLKVLGCDVLPAWASNNELAYLTAHHYGIWRFCSPFLSIFMLHLVSSHVLPALASHGMPPWAHLVAPEVQWQPRPIQLLSTVLLSASLYIFKFIDFFLKRKALSSFTSLSLGILFLPLPCCSPLSSHFSMLKQQKITLLKQKKVNSFGGFFISANILVPRQLCKTSDKLWWESKGEGGRIWGEDKARATPHWWFRHKEMWSERDLPALVLVSCELCSALAHLLSLHSWSCGGSQLAPGQPVGRLPLATESGAGVTLGASWGTGRWLWWGGEIQLASATAHSDICLYINCAERKEWDLAQQ